MAVNDNCLHRELLGEDEDYRCQVCGLRGFPVMALTAALESDKDGYYQGTFRVYIPGIRKPQKVVRVIVMEVKDE